MKNSERNICYKNDPIRLEAYMMMKNVRRRHKKPAFKNYSNYDIDIEYLTNLIKNFCDNNYYVLESKNPFKPSIERINNNEGYTKENIKIVWLIENYCRNEFTEKDVVEFCKRNLNLI